MAILITGGTGFLGRHLIEEIFKRDLTDRVCIYSRDEYKQSLMPKDERLRYFIGDVRDRSRLARACHGVDLIIHAAALKRIEVGQYNPSEMVKTNILGSQNVVDVALAVGAKAMLVSTDKACEPISPYGYTKALAESIFLAAGQGFGVVRYGNVAGSTGSIIPVWKQKVEEGLPLPVTDFECTRFFMTVQEATDFVLDNALSLSLEREASLVTPDLPAFSLHTLFQVFDLYYNDKNVVVKKTYLPDWEKKHESMLPGKPSNEARRLNSDELGIMIKELLKR